MASEFEDNAEAPERGASATVAAQAVWGKPAGFHSSARHMEMPDEVHGGGLDHERPSGLI